MSEYESRVMQFYDEEVFEGNTAIGLDLIADIRRRRQLAESGEKDVLAEIRNRIRRDDVWGNDVDDDILEMIRARAKK